MLVSLTHFASGETVIVNLATVRCIHICMHHDEKTFHYSTIMFSDDHELVVKEDIMQLLARMSGQNGIVHPSQTRINYGNGI